MQHLPPNFNGLSAKEKIRLIVPQKNPLENDSLVLIGEQKRTYLMEIIPQKKDTFERDISRRVVVKCIAKNMEETFTGICSLLTDNFYVFESESQKRRECGKWYEGNKYFLNLLESNAFRKIDLENENIVDARPKIDRINRIMEEDRKRSREESKRRRIERKEFELKNPAKIIRYIPDSTKNTSTIRTIDELKLQFSDIPKKYTIQKVEASYDENSFYELDLVNQTCGCDNFQKKRSIYPTNDARRLCEHLQHALLEKYATNISDLAECLTSHQGSLGLEISRCQLSSGVPFYIGQNSSQSEWIDIYARKRKTGEKEGNFTGAYERYGYNLLERRWSYGEGPAGAKEIKMQIAKQFPSISKPKPQSGQETEGCYIATAIYGSYSAPEVLALRRFRDDFLKKNLLGRLLISLYCLVSPSIAIRLENTTRVNGMVRRILDRFVELIG